MGAQHRNQKATRAFTARSPTVLQAMYTYIVADPVMLDSCVDEPLLTCHLRAATLLQKELVKQRLMKGNQPFHWGVGFSNDSNDGFKISPCQGAGTQLSPSQQEQFRTLLFSLQERYMSANCSSEKTYTL